MDQNAKWDLSSIYSGVDDPRIEADLDRAQVAAKEFRSTFSGKIDDRIPAAEFAGALQRYEALQRVALVPYHFAYLLFASNSEADSHKALLARAREVLTGVTEETLFFELDILKLSADAYRRLRTDSAVASYGHYLDNTRAHAPYALSEEVEQVIKRKDLSGKEAFVSLFDEMTSSFRYRFKMPGETEEREVSGEELLALLYHPDRQMREEAFATFLRKHADHATVLVNCFNNILLDHGREADLRRYPDLMTPTHLSSETEPEMVETLMRVTEENYGLAQRYFRLKRKLLGYEQMKNSDLYAPIGATTRTFSYEEAKDLVLESFGLFSSALAEPARQILEQGHADVFPAPGKGGGAFCMGILPEWKPYVLLNFTGNLRDVSTLAHELGHAVHYVLSGRQNLFHYHAPLPMAETASVFGEMLLTRELLNREDDRQLKIALLCSKLEDIIATTFRQNALTRFEQAAHARRGKGLLSAADYCDLWWQENARLFGSEVEMIEPYRWGWAYISHFIHARFYCYSYVFGELLVLALYQRFLLEGEAFIPKFIELLAAGGSARPQEILAPFGIDLADAQFWQSGYDFVAAMLDNLEALVAES
ncbi:M3 family oligoendopeptidase [Malonomonas rubra]|uniref:M3 family oligoendopeptidase n=1 Tax=Malonomonas rubra TaxID=57040 RepID=UPI0026EEA1F0|nr:M3 family oligoendopeptidase [Malonomonas rubra]